MNIYEQALTAVNENKISAELFTGGAKHIFLSQTNGGLYLVYQERDKHNLVRKTEQVKCAFYNPRRGWIFSLDRDTYRRWVARTGHEVSKPNLVAPRLCMGVA